MTPIRLLVVGGPQTLVQRVAAIAARSEVFVLVGDVSLDGGASSVARALSARVTLLDLRSSDALPPSLITELLAAGVSGVVALLAPRGQALPDPLVRSIGTGRVEMMRVPADATPEVAARWDQALADVIRAAAHGWSAKPPALRANTPRPAPTRAPTRIIGIAASTGGPPALTQILGALPSELPAALLIAQHMTPGFGQGLIDLLAKMTSLAVAVADDGASPEPGHVYLPPDGCDLGLDEGLRLHVRRSPEIHSPSADHLLTSLARSLGTEAVGIVLTGMGSDGARGLKAIRQAGGTTIAQDESSSIIFGMPKVAIDMGAADEILPLEHIAAAIRRIAGRGAATPIQETGT